MERPKERVAQCVADQLSKNERSAGTKVRVCLPRSCYEGVKNPLDAMAKELVYPDRPMIECLSALEDVECVDMGAGGSSGGAYDAARRDATHVVIANEYAPDLLESVETFIADVRAGKCPRLKRLVVMTHIGVERRDVDPFKFMNRATRVGTGIIGQKSKPGGAPLDRWHDAEELVRAAVPREKDAAAAAGRSRGFERATPVQAAAIGLLAGNKDVAVEACTGSGKTLAFVLPLVEILSRAESRFRPHQVGAVVVSPTRELAKQIFDVAAPFLRTIPRTSPPMLLVGGTDPARDVRGFDDDGACCLVGTPGRLDDVMIRAKTMDLKVCSIHWSPYDPVGVVDADP